MLDECVQPIRAKLQAQVGLTQKPNDVLVDLQFLGQWEMLDFHSDYLEGKVELRAMLRNEMAERKLSYDPFEARLVRTVDRILPLVVIERYRIRASFAVRYGPASARSCMFLERCGGGVFAFDVVIL